MDVIDGKSSALLTHISVMFVVLSIFLVASDAHAIVKFLIGVELILYLTVAMFMLRCIDIMGPPFRPAPGNLEEAENAYYFELNLRRTIYHRAIRTVYVLTLALIPIVLAKYALQFFG